jgi:hypothetical protein
MDVVVVRGAGQDLNEADLIGNDCKDVEKMLFVWMRERNCCRGVVQGTSYTRNGLLQMGLLAQDRSRRRVSSPENTMAFHHDLLFLFREVGRKRSSDGSARLSVSQRTKRQRGTYGG